MFYQAFAAPFRPSLVAADAAIAALLRCYCREIAEPGGDVAVALPAEVGLGSTPPFALLNAVLRIAIDPGAEILIGVERDRPLQGYRFLTSPFLRIDSGPVRALGWAALADVLYADIARRTGIANSELADQTANSVAMTTALLTASGRSLHLGSDAAAGYLQSEAGLPLGHAFHPTPKAREGVAVDAIVRYSPESRRPFDLAYFAVSRDHLRIRQTDGACATDMLASCLPDFRDDGRQILPVHPLQASALRDDPRIVRALAEGWLEDLGTHARPFHATSSVRTVIGPADPWFLKLSLAVRMTNCVRKNAAYELDGAVAMTTYMAGYEDGLRQLFPGFRLLSEPASLSIDAPGWDDADRTALIEGFGLILRRSLLPLAPMGTSPLLAGALFSPGLGRPALGHRLLHDRPAAARAAWIGRYAAALVPPILHALFHHGIAFEPHLQNVVVSLIGDEPDGIYLRDYEGVKLTPLAKDTAAIDRLNDVARAALRYDGDAGWRRVAYCLFVNHLGEAIRHLSDDDAGVETASWKEVAGVVAGWQRRFGTTESKQRLDPLLAGGPLPAKATLLTRFERRRDRDSLYIDVAGPFGAC